MDIGRKMLHRNLALSAAMTSGARTMQRNWTDVKNTGIDSGNTPWGFDATGLSASAALTRETANPVPYEGASYLKCAISGADSGNAFARGQFTIAIQGNTIVRYRMAIYLPTGFNEAVTGSIQISRLDPFPTTNNAQGLIYDKAANNWRLYVKNNNVDSNITGTFTMSEGAWHLIEVQTLLHASAGWANVWVDGVLVASAANVRTIYDADDGSGTLVTRFRAGLVAIGSALQGALTVHLDSVDLDKA